MGFLPIKSNFQEKSHWVFNPPLYVKVREKNIRTITMKILTEIGEEFHIEDDVVTCRLHFRRRPFLTYTYIRNNDTKSYYFNTLKYRSTNWILQGSL